MITKYYVKCPMKDLCKKGNTWLGNKTQGWLSERRARQAVFDHLTSSPFHEGLTREEAALEADHAEVEPFDEEVEDAEDGNMSDDDRKRKWEEDQVWYDDPEKRQPKKRARPAQAIGNIASEGASGSRSLARQSGPDTRALKHLSQDLSGQIHAQTQNAYVFVKADSGCF